MLMLCHVRKCKREDCQDCYPSPVGSIFQRRTEENANCQDCDQSYSANCPSVLAEEKELLDTIDCSFIDFLAQNREPNWFDFWSLQVIKNLQ